MPAGFTRLRSASVGGAALLAVVLGILLPPRPATAWGAKGHRIVCTVAWDELTDATRNRLKALLGITDRDQFAAGCAAQEAAGHGLRHRMFVGRDVRTLDLARDCPLPAGCLVREIEQTLAVLAGGGPDAGKAAAVSRLGHLVADLHQPLNLGFAEDGGGARIPATFMDRPSTMRAIWDEGLLDGLPEPGRLNSRIKIYGELFRIGGRSASWTETGPLAWANESLWIMRTPATGYVGNPGGLDFGALYVKQNELVAFEQIDKAAVRLAHLLEKALE